MEKDNSKNINLTYRELKNIALSQFLLSSVTLGTTAGFAFLASTAAPNTPARIATLASSFIAAGGMICSFRNRQRLKKRLNSPEIHPKNTP